MNGKSDILEVKLESQSVLWRPAFDLKNEPVEGWISITCPDDFCQYDNICYLTYGSTEPPQVAVRASNPRTSLILRSASQTEQGDLADSLPLSGFGEKDLLSRKILIHQGEINSEVEKVLEEFVVKVDALFSFQTKQQVRIVQNYFPGILSRKSKKMKFFQSTIGGKIPESLQILRTETVSPLTALKSKDAELQNKVRLLPITPMASPSSPA